MRTKKKRILSVLLSLALVLSMMPGLSMIQTAYADDSLFYTLDGSQYVNNTNYASESDISQNNINWKVTGNTAVGGSDNFTHWKIGGKSISEVDRPVYSVDNLKANVSKVELELGNFTDNTITVNSIKLIVAGDASFSNVIEEQTRTNITANTTLTFTPSAGKQWSDSYYKFVFNITVTENKNKAVDFKSAKFYGTSAYSSHTHSFTYSASGATITAKCSAEGCPLPPSTQGGSDHVATLTIAAPDSLAYDGNAKAAKIIDEYKIQGDAKVMYQKKTGNTYGEATETAPTDTGTYKASITLGEGEGAKTASVEYTITATPLTITGATLTSRDYEKDNKKVAVTAVTFDGGTPALGTDFTAEAEMADDTAGDNKAVTVTVTLENDNYSLAKSTFDTTVKIKKVKPVAPIAPTAASVTHNSVTLKATDGYQYKMDGGDGWQDSAEFKGLDEDTNYTFYQRVKGDANHEDSDSSEAAIIKTKLEPVSYAVASKSGNMIIITIRTLTEYVKAKTTNNTVWLKDGDFYVVKGDVTLNRGLIYSGNVNILLCDNSRLTIRGGLWHYGSELTIYGQSGQSGEIVVEGDKDITLDNVPAGIDPSKVSKDSVLDGGTININGGKISAIPGSGQKMCGNNATVEFLDNVTFTGIKETGEKETLAGGSYGAAKLNQFKSFDAKGKEAAVVTTAPKAKTGLISTGKAQALVIAGKAEGGTMQYVIGKNAQTAPTSGWSKSIPKGTKAGTYYVWYKAVGDESHIDAAPKCIKVKISKAITKVTVNVKTVSAKAVNKAVKKAGAVKSMVKTIVLGKKTKKISKGAFKNFKKVKTLVVKTKKLKKAKVKKSLKGSKITKIKVDVGSKKMNKKYVKKYKKIFKKKNSGKKVKVTL